MKVFATWILPDELRNALVRHLDEFEAAHPGCRLEIFVENSPPVTTAAFLREPASSVAQAGPSGPQLSPLERAMAAVRDNPGRPARAIAKQIGVSHQTVLRAQAALQRATAPAVVQSRNHGPRGPERRRP